MSIALLVHWLGIALKPLPRTAKVLAKGALALMLVPAWAAATPPDAIAPACDSSDNQSVVQASPPGAVMPAAQAYWLNRRLIQWPGITAASGIFKLHTSSSGQIQARVGEPVRGADSNLSLQVTDAALPAHLAQRFKHIAAGVRLRLADELSDADGAVLRQRLGHQWMLTQESPDGRVLQLTALQSPGLLDDLFSAAARADDLGATPVTAPQDHTSFKLWAPTALRVGLCLYANGQSPASHFVPLALDGATGIWQGQLPVSTGRYYTYLVDVFVAGMGVVRNRVTDPYSVSLTTDSRRSYFADMDAASLKPPGWDSMRPSPRVKSNTDIGCITNCMCVIFDNDATVAPPHRGKYLAFTDARSQGMRHLRALARAGLTDVHLLPVFDFATIPEQGCSNPRVPSAAPDSEAQQAAVMSDAAHDCFNWGYDPFHFNAPEGSYASDPADGATRMVEFRAMVQALHRSGLRVGMDVVYNHMTASGQAVHSVLDRIVPGYYHRLNDQGVVERSTCCDNTATEHLMMGKLMIDSVAHWARHYHIDSFRFDLMAHQPKDVMLDLSRHVDQVAGRHINLIGEGWNFGEVADAARFVQASQLSLNGTGIGSFSDRGRDAIRGGSAADSGAALVKNQGYINGLVYDPNDLATPAPVASELLHAADQVRVMLAGSVRDYTMVTAQGLSQRLEQLDYHGQPAGYVAQPGEVVNYVENHDNQTLFDINAYRLPLTTSHEDRVRVQMLGAALVALSQGVAYFHAGIDTLRSKSLDGNSFDSGDWFNRLDWSYQDNYFATGAPPAADNRANYPWIKPRLATADIKPRPRDIALARDMFRDLLRIRTSSSLLRLRSAADIAGRLQFLNTGPQQIGTVQVGHLDGRGYPGAHFRELLYLVNVDKQAHTINLPTERGKAYVLHPVLRHGADARIARESHFDRRSGQVSLPGRSTVVYVIP